MESLRLVMAELQVAKVRAQVALSLFTDFENFTVFTPVGGRAFALPLLDWVNDGLLAVFSLVVGLEIKREFTVGHLAELRAAALPVCAAFGGIVLPALIYPLVSPPEMKAGWGVPISTDTAFGVALIVLLGDRVPVELRVFLTAAVIIDDLVAVAVIALFTRVGSVPAI